MERYVGTHLKNMNRQKTYGLLMDVDQISKSEISRRLRISAPTVIKIIDTFKKHNFIVELGSSQINGQNINLKAGRPADMIRINERAVCFIGVLYEGGIAQAGVVDLKGNLLAYRSINTENNLLEFLRRDFLEMASGLLECTADENIIGICIGLPCVVDGRRNAVQDGPLVGIYSETDISDILKEFSKELELPVLIENDVNVAAIGEFVQRRYTKTDSMLYVSLGTGLGMGMIVNGSLYQSKNFQSGQLGYMSFDTEYSPNPSDPGWLESKINLYALGLRPNDLQSVLDSDKELLVAKHLALAISNVVKIIDIRTVVLGGLVFDILGESMARRVEEYIGRYYLGRISCTLGSKEPMGVIGAAELAAQNLIFDYLHRLD